MQLVVSAVGDETAVAPNLCLATARPPLFRGFMATFLYRCPNTSSMVQGFVQGFVAEETPGNPDAYESITCLACRQLHLVNPTTGRVLGDHEGEPRDNNMPAIHTIMHPTDFSELSMNAFTHALSLSLAVKAKLYLLHVAQSQTETWDRFPHVRRTLAGWGLFDEKELPTQLMPKLGIEVIKVEVEPQHPAKGLAHFLASHATDLLVLATHSRDGLQRWIKPSVAEAMARHSIAPALFIAPECRGFIDQTRGAIRLRRVLVPVDHSPPAGPALRRALEFCRKVSDKQIEYQLVHFGEPPKIEGMQVGARKESDIVDGILRAAAEIGADLIAMVTAGHRGMLDALRGSTTERVVRHARCPVLAVPATIHEFYPQHRDHAGAIG